MGRMMNSILYLTRHTHTIFSSELSSWLLRVTPNKNQKNIKNQKNQNVTHIESCSVRTFALIERSLGPAGLRGLDRLFAFRTVFEFNSFLTFYEAQVSEHSVFLEQVKKN